MITVRRYGTGYDDEGNRVLVLSASCDCGNETSFTVTYRTNEQPTIRCNACNLWDNTYDGH